MSEQRIKISLELGKILVGLFTAFTVVFYAGMLNQKTADNERRIDNLEKKMDQIIMMYTKKAN